MLCVRKDCHNETVGDASGLCDACRMNYRVCSGCGQRVHKDAMHMLLTGRYRCVACAFVQLNLEWTR